MYTLPSAPFFSYLETFCGDKVDTVQFIIRSFFGISLLNFFFIFNFNKLGLVSAWRWMDDEINQTDSQWFCFNQNMILTTSYFWLHSMAWFIFLKKNFFFFSLFGIDLAGDVITNICYSWLGDLFFKLILHWWLFTSTKISEAITF